MRSLSSLFLLLLLSGFSAALTNSTAAAQRSEVAEQRGQEMLGAIRDDLMEHYYDRNFHGLDLETRLKAASDRIKTAKSTGAIFAIIAQAVVELNDSHTFFLPPGWGAAVDYGIRTQVIGDACLIVAVRRGSDAASKGLAAGQVVEEIDGFAPTRENLWKIEYSYYSLQPRDGMRLKIRELDGRTREVALKMRVLNDSDLERQQAYLEKVSKPMFRSLGKDVIICKLTHFTLPDEEIQELAKKIKSGKTLILDLRGNTGGYTSAVREFAGYFFSKDLKLGDAKGRKGSAPRVAPTAGARAFLGSLIVIIDSASASAAEIFARAVQLEGRGKVIGDRSAGAVMESIHLTHRFLPGDDGWSKRRLYGFQVTINDFIMADGKSLEHVGVVPDERVLPTPGDIAVGRDPVLSRAAAIAGVNLNPDTAGKLFPREPRTAVIKEHLPMN